MQIRTQTIRNGESSAGHCSRNAKRSLIETTGDTTAAWPLGGRAGLIVLPGHGGIHTRKATPPSCHVDGCSECVGAPALEAALGTRGASMPTGDPSPPSDEQVRALLERHKCPVPFHEVRMRLFGNIACLSCRFRRSKWCRTYGVASCRRWTQSRRRAGHGLWNRLMRHQDRSSPFRLMRVDTASTPEGLAALALMRRQELDGFIEGLFGRERGGRPAEAAFAASMNSDRCARCLKRWCTLLRTMSATNRRGRRDDANACAK